MIGFGCLLYLTATRLDIVLILYLQQVISQDSCRIHVNLTLEQPKGLLRYVKRTTSFGIHFKTSNSPRVVDYTNYNWAGPQEDMKIEKHPRLYIYTRKWCVFLVITKIRHNSPINGSPWNFTFL